MPRTVRGKLFLTSLALMLGVGLASLIFLEHGLRRWLHGRVETQLRHYAASSRVLVEGTPDLPSRADELADRLGHALSARVTIIADDGRALGDSELSPQELIEGPNRNPRPEVKQARRDGTGVALRYSTTLHMPMLYVAERFAGVGGSGVVRVSTPLSEVSAVVARLRWFLVFAGLIGLLVAVAMSGLASTWASRALLPLVEHATAVASGQRLRRLSVSSRDELGLLAGSFNRLAEDLDRAVDELIGERDWLETVLESMGEAMIALDEHDRVERINRAALALLGAKEVQAGQPVVELVRSPAFADLLPRVRNAGHASEEFTLAGSTPRRVLARAAALEVRRGVVVVMLDVTEMRRLENVRRDFVANVSHELRTPISIIRANAETLLEGALSDPKHAPGFVEGIARNAERLGAIVSDLLSLARIEAQKLTLEMAQVAVRALADRVVENLSAAAAAKSITVYNRIADELQVRADHAALQQILGNLLENAIKYTPDGGSVELRQAAGGGGVSIEVCDDGPGIEPRHRERIFERFYRVDPGRSRDVGGTGLGLSIVRHLAEAIGAVVSVHDNQPRGSIFRITFSAG